MSVYIKDMEMPENCDVCPIRLVYLTCGCDREHCMIQEVQEPHGRLIDTDILCAKMLMVWDVADKEQEQLISAVIADIITPVIVSTPTVIPRSEVET